jgi:hypothetical protein
MQFRQVVVGFGILPSGVTWQVVANCGGSKFTHHRDGALWSGMKSRKQACIFFLLKMSVTV